jgi:large subunit ribosomal protein L21
MEDGNVYAIVRTGGKQYRVNEKTVFSVEKLAGEVGETLQLTDVLMIADGDGVTIGQPVVPGATVTATIMEHGLGKKIHGYTYRPTKGTQRHYGHRQPYTMLKVTAITV